MTPLTRLRKLIKEARRLKEEKAVKKSLRMVSFEGYKCYHAEDDCPCTCDLHDWSHEVTLYRRPENCVCDQYHKPPEKPCGCFSKGDFKFFKDLYGPLTNVIPFDDPYDPDAFRLVPDRYTLGPFGDKGNPFKIFKRGKQVIKSSQGHEEILGSLP